MASTHSGTDMGSRSVDITRWIRVIWYRDPVRWGIKLRRYPGGINLSFGKNDLHVKLISDDGRRR